MQGIALIFTTILLYFYLTIRVKWSNRIRRIFVVVQILRHIIFWRDLSLCKVLHYYLLLFFYVSKYAKTKSCV